MKTVNKKGNENMCVYMELALLCKTSKQNKAPIKNYK